MLAYCVNECRTEVIAALRLVFDQSATFRAANPTPVVPGTFSWKFPAMKTGYNNEVPFQQALNPKLPLWVHSEAIATVKGSGGTDDLPGMTVCYCVNVKLGIAGKEPTSSFYSVAWGTKDEISLNLKKKKKKKRA